LNKSDINRNIGVFIKVLRIRKGLNREELAEAFNNTEPKDITTNEKSIGRYERGEVTIPGDKYEKFRIVNKILANKPTFEGGSQEAENREK
jgi:transcriptional regulator with XRE-family HTH domain